MTAGERWIAFLRSYGPVSKGDNMFAETVARQAANYGVTPLAFVHPEAAALEAAFLPAEGRLTNVILTGTAGDGKTSLCNELWFRLTGDSPRWLPDPLLVPTVHDADRALRRVAIHLARAAIAHDTAPASALFSASSALATRIADLQADFDPLIARCPGRTLAQRRSVFLRLQRVRNYMASSCHLDLDIAGFARMASYSPCHFIRAFSTVYGETPHAELVEHRLGRAHRLINESELAITEIARASGFENRCAFSRSFKRRFGITATDLREGARAAALEDA